MLTKEKKQTLLSLLPPIFLEAFLVTLVGVIDTVMVSAVSDNAVGAVGASNGNLYIVNMALAIVSVGAAAVMSRFVGAGKRRNAVRTLGISCLLNAALGLVFSLVLFFFSETILTVVGTAPEIFADAVDYTRYVGLSSVFLALNYVFSAYLRAFGKPKLTFLSATFGNVVNVVLNAVFLSFGFGALGIALATLIARVVTLGFSIAFALSIRIEKNESEVLQTPKEVIRSILVIGVPAAAESIMWTVWNAVNIHFINGMGYIAVNAYGYLSQMASMLSCLITAFTEASAILVGWNVGAGDKETTFETPKRAFRSGTLVGLGVNVLLIPVIRPILSLMTDDAAILAYAVPITAIQLVRLWGDFGNNVFGMALKTAGDPQSPLLIGLFFMPFWVFAGTYLLGIVWGLGLYGYWIGAALDELCRCLLMRKVWHSRKYEKIFEK